MNDNSHQYNYTLHHNYYRNVYQRVPKARMVNIHAYNNYFKGSVSANVDLTYDAVMYSEYNYYENIKSPVFYINRLSAPGTSTKVKSFKDHFDVDTSSNRFAQVWIGGNEKSISNGIFIASSRGDTKKIGEGKNYVDTARNYCNFDTNVKGLFYYNSSNNSSAVSTIWTNTNKVKTNLPGIVGVLKDK
jgi:pectate lyase